MKTYQIYSIVTNHNIYNYFYQKEKNDIYGNNRYRVYIIDIDNMTIYEKIFKTYENYISDNVKQFIEKNCNY